MANVNGSGQAMSYVITDSSGNQLIMQPLEYSTFTGEIAQQQQETINSPQWALDLNSGSQYMSAGQPSAGLSNWMHIPRGLPTSPTFTAGPNGTMSLGMGVTGGIGAYVNPGLGASPFDIGVYATGGRAYGFDPSLGMSYGVTFGPSSNLRGASTNINVGGYAAGIGAGGTITLDSNNDFGGIGFGGGLRGAPAPVIGVTFSTTTTTTCTFSVFGGHGCH